MRRWLLSREMAIVLLVLVIVSFNRDWKMAFRSSGIDLRNRVVGARLLEAGKDPYFYRWQEGDPLEWLDPGVLPTDSVNRCTVAPTLLGLYLPAANLPFPVQRKIWTLIQWALLALVAWTLSSQAKDSYQRRTVLLWFVIAFVTSECWRMHTERGQIYVLQAALLALSAWSYRKSESKGPLVAGLLAGVAAGLRPPCAVVALPFLLAKKWRFLGALVVGVLLTLSSSFLWAGKQTWTSYAKAMEIHGRRHLRLADWPNDKFAAAVKKELPKLLKDTELHRLFRTGDGVLAVVEEGADQERIEKHIRETLAPRVGEAPYKVTFSHLYPEKAEGEGLEKWQLFPIGSSGFVRFFRDLGTPHRLQLMKLLTVLFLLSYGGILMQQTKGELPPRVLFIIGTALPVMVEYLLPAPRYLYNNIGWCVPVALLLLQVGPAKVLRGVSGVLLTIGLVGANGIVSAAWGDLRLSGPLLFAAFAMIGWQLVRSPEFRESGWNEGEE